MGLWSFSSRMVITNWSESWKDGEKRGGLITLNGVNMRPEVGKSATKLCAVAAFAVFCAKTASEVLHVCSFV